jgi:23S rRNA pseudouridine1911/1915/1917 synthase
VLERLGQYGSLVKVEPKTGRYHQIRIHFSELGYSLYGDRLYGDRRDPIHATRHLLHAARVLLPHPTGGPNLDIECPLPQDMRQAMEQLRNL